MSRAPADPPRGPDATPRAATEPDDEMVGRVSTGPDRPPKKRTPPALHGAAYLAIRALLSAPLIAGPNASVEIAGSLGRRFGAARFNRKRLDRAIASVAHAFPDRDQAWARETAIRSYEHLFRLGIEVAYTPRLMSDEGWVERCELANVGPAMGAIAQNERPVLMLTGHCGNWELLGYTMALIGFPTHALYRPLDMKPLDAWLRRTRQRRGLVLVDKFGAARVLPKLIEQHKPIGFVADQNAGDRGLFVPFMGRLASTYKTIGLLARRFRADVICACARRLSDRNMVEAAPPLAPGEVDYAGWSIERAGNFRYRLEIHDVIRAEDYEPQPDPLFYLTARYRRAIEQMVRRAPEQYLWMHRMWKSRPRHERLNRPFPAPLREKLAALPWMDDAGVEQIVAQSDQDRAWLKANGTDRLG
ncbi:MAG: hypothetical protein EA378_05925 [Phycisphaerales bacterium]|nr:MAG: hypothetical protein EA378_05925 [Phycisphaerales bacterium]